MKRLAILTILFALCLVLGCKKENASPTPPVITFLDAQLSSDKTACVVRFDFYDANGDLGLRQEENEGEQQYNILVNYYEKENGAWQLKSPIVVEIPDPTVPSGVRYDTTITHLRFPFIENTDGGELSGEVAVELFYNNFIQPLADTFRYEIYIKDRALLQSNTITTATIVVN